MKKKNKAAVPLIAVILVLALVFCTACGKTAEYGKILKVDTTEDENSSKENVFTPVKDNLGYQYQKVRHPRAYMNLNVPAAWNVKMHNARHLEIISPKDDPQIPGVTLHILSDYSLSNENHDTVGLYGKLFEKDLMGMYYTIDGNYRQTGYASPTSQDTDTSFSKRADMLSFCEIEDVNLKHQSSGTSPAEECNALQYYVKWSDIPVVFSAVCKKDDTEKIKRLLTYMVSSITYTNAAIDTVRMVKYDGLTFPVPNGFVKKEENVYLADYKTSSSCSGMGIAVYCAPEKVSAESIMFDYAKDMSAAFLPGGTSGYENIYSCPAQSESVTIDGTSADIYTATATIISNKSKPGDFYISGQTWYLTIYALAPDDNGQKLIVIWSQDSQVKLLNTIKQMVKERVKID